jgi:hypothetical protein
LDWQKRWGKPGKRMTLTGHVTKYRQELVVYPVSGRCASAKSVRQSVTIPATLADVRRVARERYVTMRRALVALAERGVRAEIEAKQHLKATCRNFVDASSPSLRTGRSRPDMGNLREGFDWPKIHKTGDPGRPVSSQARATCTHCAAGGEKVLTGRLPGGRR